MNDAPIVYDKYRGEVEFRYLTDAVFRYRLGDLQKLSQKFGPGYLGKLDEACDKHDADTIEVFTTLGLKTKGGGPTVKIDFSDPPWPLAAVYVPIKSAIMFAITGMTADEAAEAERKAVETYKADVAKELEPGPSDGLVTSSSESAGPESVTG